MHKQLLFTPEEGAAVIRVKRSKFFELLASGEIQSIRIGRLRRIPAAALEAWVNRQLMEQGLVEDQNGNGGLHA